MIYDPYLCGLKRSTSVGHKSAQDSVEKKDGKKQEPGDAGSVLKGNDLAD